jgi:hypothetical protein
MIPYMKKIKVPIVLFFLMSTFLFSQEERKVLVEVFTNSHCPFCPPAHNVITNYLSGPNGDKISYIFYHMIYPYSDDPLYWESMEGSDARDNYYNPVHATPQGWFDGNHQSSSTGWMTSLDNLVMQASPLKIILSGTRSSNQFNINAQLTRTGEITDSDLAIHFVVVEDVYFDGRNTISNHKHVMRKMFPAPAGKTFSINLNETINIDQTIDLETDWDTDSLSVVVFIQSSGTKAVYQSATIGYNNLVVKSEYEFQTIPNEFILQQNYPNPFNPSTTISWQSPVSSHQTLKVYDLLGREIATLVDEYKPAGRYEVNFDANDLTGGVYFYKLTSDNFIRIKKFILVK